MNGLLTYDRRVLKPDVQRVKAAHQALIRDASQAAPAGLPDHVIPHLPRLRRTAHMRWTRRLRLCLAGAVAASALFAVPGTAQATEPRDGRLTDLVNPFIGTENEGNTYPGAAVPFGMVQFSPDTGHNTGYDYSENHIRGFSAVHLSGVGCGLGGDLPVLPTTGDVTADRQRQVRGRVQPRRREARAPATTGSA